MRVLLDECLPRQLTRQLVGHQAQTVPDLGWASKENGELLALAAGRFDVFLTVDRNTLTNRDERLLDVLKRAGGLTEDAYVRGAKFFRAEGIGVDLERVLGDPSYRDNLILFAGDSLHVPQYQPVVRVDGTVNSPVAVAYRPGAGSRYYVDRAGGFWRNADRKHTYVVQPNGSVQRRNVDPEPGARIFVPEVPAGEEKTDWGAVLSSVASILTSALTIILVVQRL